MTLSYYIAKVTAFMQDVFGVETFPDWFEADCETYFNKGVSFDGASEKILEDMKQIEEQHRLEALEEEESDNWELPLIVVGKQIYVDRSGVGHAWRKARNIDAEYIIQEEIAEMINDGGNETCKDFVAGNGVHYRW